MNIREKVREAKRIVIKIGSSSITHSETGELYLSKIEKLVRQIADLKGSGKEIILVSSGAIATGIQALGIHKKPGKLSEKQALAAIGQSRLLSEYRKIFSEYNLRIAQILMTKITMIDDISRENAKATFTQLLMYGAIPIVNENDTISTYEIQFGDNDRLSALVSALVRADLLILLSDIDGLYTDDPNTDKYAKFVDYVENVDNYMEMGKSTSKSDLGTGGMYTKLLAAKIATNSGADMVIASADDMSIIESITKGEHIGTYFPAIENPDFDLLKCLE